uniref:Dynein heavy chain tail domain-containing protein n=1 Tax=Scylla olivacea TaxID=85551 RepID=A0A0P4WEV1_SCYOL
MKRREEQERRARRGDTDPRYEYIFQVLAACAGIARHQVMDHVFEENLLEEISKFLMPGQYNNMVWFYQECEESPDEKATHEEEEEADAKSPTSPLLSQPSSGQSRRNSVVSGPTEQQHSRRNSTATQHTEDGEAEQQEPGKRMRLFVGNPRTTPLRGVCVCMTRTNPQRSVTEENVHREVNFMLLRASDDPSVLLRSVNRLLGRVFVPAVRTNPSDLDSAPGSGSARDHLLAGLRSFASSLHVSESILEERVVLAKAEEGAGEVRGLTEAQAALTQPDQVAAVERSVVTWLKQIESVLIEMEQLRQETDDAGPQDELEYWKRRMAKFKFLAEQMDSPQVRNE